MRLNFDKTWSILLYWCGLLLVVTACTNTPSSETIQTVVVPGTPEILVVTPTPEPEAPRSLTICIGQEPKSLFYYGDASLSAMAVFEAIYDGPYDTVAYLPEPVIMESVPNLENGGAFLEAVQVSPGEIFVDNAGEINQLAEGVLYRPSGCTSKECALEYSGSDPVMIDRLVVHFTIIPGILWSDGEPLTADDSVFSFEIFKSMFGDLSLDIIEKTGSYVTLDDLTVEWRGIPGFQDATYTSNFFVPLPRHAWESIPVEEYLSAEITSRTPLGWGPYVIEEWVDGDHISLSKNENYFRADEGLPHYEDIVYRFVQGSDEALVALLVEECDIVDQSVGLEEQGSLLLQLEEQGQLSLVMLPGTGWEHADFGILPMDESEPPIFAAREIRQAVAMCIDRQRIVDELFYGISSVPLTYVPNFHPLFNEDAASYNYDPEGASQMLETAGWVDSDDDPTTPRIAWGAYGIPFGTEFDITYLVPLSKERQAVAQIVQESLAGCGINIDLVFYEWEDMLAPGPLGPVFGRDFDMAQYAWVTALEPPCYLYQSQEIPGPYPQFQKGWGGANATGYSNTAFDDACQEALNSLPDTEEHIAAHATAQSIFAEDLPVIPLYLRIRIIATRPDMCNVSGDPSGRSVLSQIEDFYYAESCQ